MQGTPVFDWWNQIETYIYRVKLNPQANQKLFKVSHRELARFSNKTYIRILKSRMIGKSSSARLTTHSGPFFARSEFLTPNPSPSTGPLVSWSGTEDAGVKSHLGIFLVPGQKKVSKIYYEKKESIRAGCVPYLNERGKPKRDFVDTIFLLENGIPKPHFIERIKPDIYQLVKLVVD